MPRLLVIAGLVAAGLSTSVNCARAAGGPYLYATDFNSTVAAIDMTTNTVAATIPVGSAPTDVLLNPAGTKAYVANAESGTISVIDTSSNTVSTTIALGAYPYTVVFNASGTRAYTSTISSITGTGTGAISVIDTGSDTVAQTIALPFVGGAGIVLNPAGTLAYVADEGDNALAVVDLETGTVTASIPLPLYNAPFNVAISPDGAKVYVDNHSAGGCSVSVIDTATNTLTTTIPAGDNAINLALSPSGSLLYVPNQDDGNVTAIDTGTNSVTTTIPVGANPVGAAFSATGAVGYIGNNSSISVIHTASGTVTATIPIGGSAIYSIAVPQIIQPTATTLTVSPSGSTVEGNPVTLTAAETPATNGTVQFFDGANPLGPPVSVNAGMASYTTATLGIGPHSLTAAFTPASSAFASSTSSEAALQVNAPPFAIDQSITRNSAGTVTTPPLTTTGPRLLVAFTSADGPATKQTTTVTGTGLTWNLVQRANSKGGTAEIWTAYAPGPLTTTVTSTPKAAGYDQSLTILAFTGASGIGASTSAGKAKGAPTVSLTSTQPDSWSFAVGEDYSHAIARTLGDGQNLISQWVDPGPGETFWVQDVSAVTPAAGTIITLSDTAPTGDIWNMAAAEVLRTTS